MKKLNIFDVPCLAIENTYSEDELQVIRNEISFIEPKIGDEEKTNAAKEKTPYGEKRKKRGRGVFLDDVYTDRRYSSILNCSRKLFHTPEFLTCYAELAETNIYWKLWPHTNHDSTLLQCYGNGDYYEYHQDSSQFTIITVLNFNDAYEGGELHLRLNREVYNNKSAHNTTLIFPSVIDHTVTEVKIQNKIKDIFDYRWTVSHLVTSRT